MYKFLTRSLVIGYAICNTIRHPIKTYESAVLGVPWYD
jgi:hypothetical protein